MGGQVHGSVDHITGNTGSVQNNHQEHFVVVNNFLASRFTRIASYYGSGGTGLDGAGLDFWDAGSGQAAREAFAVYRIGGTSIPSYNLVVSWSDNGWSTWSVQNSASTSADYTAIGAAIKSGGGDTWAGTTVDDGTDTNAASPRWSIGAGSRLFTFNWYNEPGGARATNKEDLMPVSGLMNAVADRTLTHMWADDDSVLFVFDDDLNGDIVVTYVGAYELLTGETHDDGLPAIGLYAANLRWPTPGGGGGFVFGSTLQEGGGLLPPKLGGVAPGTPAFHLDTMLDSTESESYQPNRQRAQGGYHAPKHAIINRQGALLGHCGHLPGWIRYAIGLPMNGRNAGDGSTVPHRAFFGTGASDVRGVLPWHSGGPPGAAASRAGTQFTWVGTGTPS